jgi:hypothetical protein
VEEPTVSRYSEQSQKLAKELAEKAAKNLRGSGKTVTRNAKTGQYLVARDAPKNGTGSINQKG